MAHWMFLLQCTKINL